MTPTEYESLVAIMQRIRRRSAKWRKGGRSFVRARGSGKASLDREILLCVIDTMAELAAHGAPHETIKRWAAHYAPTKSSTALDVALAVERRERP